MAKQKKEGRKTAGRNEGRDKGCDDSEAEIKGAIILDHCLLAMSSGSKS